MIECTSLLKLKITFNLRLKVHKIVGFCCNPLEHLLNQSDLTDYSTYNKAGSVWNYHVFKLHCRHMNTKTGCFLG